MRVSRRGKEQEKRFLPHHYTLRSSKCIHSPLSRLQWRPFIPHRPRPTLGYDGTRGKSIPYAKLRELTEWRSAHMPHVINFHWLQFDSIRWHFFNSQLAITSEIILSIKATRYKRGKIATENIANGQNIRNVTTMQRKSSNFQLATKSCLCNLINWIYQLTLNSTPTGSAFNLRSFHEENRLIAKVLVEPKKICIVYLKCKWPVATHIPSNFSHNKTIPLAHIHIQSRILRHCHGNSFLRNLKKNSLLLQIIIICHDSDGSITLVAYIVIEIPHQLRSIDAAIKRHKIQIGCPTSKILFHHFRNAQYFSSFIVWIIIKSFVGHRIGRTETQYTYVLPLSCE